MQTKMRQQKQSPLLTDNFNSNKESVTFGDVTVRIKRPAPSVFSHNIQTGQHAMKQVKAALKKPGVNINSKDAPLYYCSPDYPDLIVREQNGIKTVGRFGSSGFRKVEIKKTK